MEEATRDYLRLGPPAEPPHEYIVFTQTRAFWKELGLHRDEMTMDDIADASLFLNLESKYAKHGQNSA